MTALFERSAIERQLEDLDVTSSADAGKVGRWMKSLKQRHFPDEDVIFRSWNYYDCECDCVYFAEIVRKKKVVQQVPTWSFLGFQSKHRRTIEGIDEECLLRVRLGSILEDNSFSPIITSPSGVHVYIAGE